jgi:hypothetical protein
MSSYYQRLMVPLPSLPPFRHSYVTPSVSTAFVDADV